MLAIPQWLGADRLVFPNGDTLQGRLLEETAEKIVFSSHMLGRLEMPAGSVRLIREESVLETEMPVRLPPKAESVAQPVQQETSVPPEATVAKNSTPANRQEALIPWWPVNKLWRAFADFQFLENWKSRVSAGFVWQSGEASKKDWSFRFQTEQKTGPSTFTLGARWDYGWQTQIGKEAVNTRDLYEGTFQYNHQWRERYFLDFKFRYRRDNLKAIDHDAENNFGVGWVFWKTERVEASIQPALTARFVSIEQRSEGWQFLVTSFLKFSYKITRRISFLEEARYSLEPANTLNWILDVMARLDAKMTDNFGVHFQWDYNFNSQVGIEFIRSNQRIISGLFYEF